MDDGVAITFLGTGDAFGSGGRLQTCFHVRTPESAFLIDCGATACIAMKRHGIESTGVDAILISHFHADHFAGVPFVLLEGRVTGRSRPLVLGGPAGLAARVETAMEVLFPGAGTEFPYPVDYVEYAGGAVAVGPTRVTTRAVVHAPATLPHALRIEAAGRVIAYSGDTEWDDALIDIARGADLFICEVSSYHGPVGIHLDFATLLRHRRAFDCRHLVLTHMGEDVIANVERVAEELDATPAFDGLQLRI